MLNANCEVVKPVALTTNLNFSSPAIDTFAQALLLDPDLESRAELGQPILVTLAEDHPGWLSTVEALIRSTQRIVIAIDEEWPEDRYCDEDPCFTLPLAKAYEMSDGQMTATPVMLHHSRSGIARLCTADLSRAYGVNISGEGRWTTLDAQFAEHAMIGVERAGSDWFWHYDEVTTAELIEVMREVEAEEAAEAQAAARLPIELPGVSINMGRWRKPALVEAN